MKRLIEITQDSLKISHCDPLNVVIEIDGRGIILTEENTDLLRMMLYDAYRYKKRKSKKGKSTQNEVLFAIAKHQGKSAPDESTKQIYDGLCKTAEIVDVDSDFGDIGSHDYLRY